MFTTIDGIRLRIPTEEPVAPESSDCCGSGSCCPCVWDYYRAQQKAWLQVQETGANQPASESADEQTHAIAVATA